MKIEVNKIMNPAFLLGTAFNIAYWHRKYHSGTICKGVSNPQSKWFQRDAVKFLSVFPFPFLYPENRKSFRNPGNVESSPIIRA